MKVLVSVVMIVVLTVVVVVGLQRGHRTFEGTICQF